jgi:L-aminopeptidase/D-esterase-like protein
MSKSKFKAVKKASATEQAAPVATTEQAPPIAPVASGRTIVAIAKELKITPQNARRLARQHASELGHSAKGQRWELSPDQEKRFIALATAPKAKPVAVVTQ